MKTLAGKHATEECWPQRVTNSPTHFSSSWTSPFDHS
uniref:Uncharacterized protein n=1 Tax=Anguilla anguilla TaxID=7936 RepID=A0A0E9RKT1_ANGAN